MTKSIISEVREIRHQIAAECGNDIDAIIAHAQAATSVFKEKAVKAA